MFAGRLRLGTIDAMAGEADIPLLKRFFLGGSGEMRGWGPYELSPLSASGAPVGRDCGETATLHILHPRNCRRIAQVGRQEAEQADNAG